MRTSIEADTRYCMLENLGKCQQIPEFEDCISCYGAMAAAFRASASGLNKRMEYPEHKP